MAIEAIVLDLDGAIRHVDPANPAEVEGARRAGFEARPFRDAAGLRADLDDLL